MEVVEVNEGEVVGMRFIDLCLERNTKTIYYIMYSKRHNIYFKTGYDG